jgi:hypothetical protein
MHCTPGLMDSAAVGTEAEGTGEAEAAIDDDGLGEPGSCLVSWS